MLDFIHSPFRCKLLSVCYFKNQLIQSNIFPSCPPCPCRHTRVSSVWWSTPTRTCPSTPSPSWTCTAARSGMRCRPTSMPYPRRPIAACCKVFPAVSPYLNSFARRDLRPRNTTPHNLLSAQLAWNVLLKIPRCDLCSLSHRPCVNHQAWQRFSRPSLSKSKNKHTRGPFVYGFRFLPVKLFFFYITIPFYTAVTVGAQQPVRVDNKSG